MLRVRTDAPSAPYLRATTLSRFEGGVWEPDRARTVPLGSERAFGAVDADADVRLGGVHDEDRGGQPRLAVGCRCRTRPWVSTGLSAGLWGAVPYNRTVVVARTARPRGRPTRSPTTPARPTLEQMRSATSVGSQVRDETTELPSDIPPIIGELALQVTAEATNDYDRLIALQRWFRGGDFKYSLDAPVEEGFDGSGAEAVAQFLEVREGYCVHFASAFALMARTLHMPVAHRRRLPARRRHHREHRRPAGVLRVRARSCTPGRRCTSTASAGSRSSPPSGLGVPTTFSSEAALPGQSDGSGCRDPGVERHCPRRTGDRRPRSTSKRSVENAAGGGRADRPRPAPGPRRRGGADRAPRAPLPRSRAAPPSAGRRRPRRRCRRGLDESCRRRRSTSAIAVPASETPRAFARRLVERARRAAPSDEHARPRDRARELLARRHALAAGWADAAADAAGAVRAALLASVPPSRRILALLAPRSLIIRPGSVYAGSAPVRAR